MTLILRPNGLGVDGRPKSYTVELPNRALAVLDKVDGKGWELTLRLGSAEIVQRGLFGSPYDVICLLEAEYPGSRLGGITLRQWDLEPRRSLA